MASISVKIYNETYTLKTDANESKVVNIAHEVDERMNKLAAQRPGMDTTKLAVWTALDLAAELAELKAKHEKLIKAIEDEI